MKNLLFVALTMPFIFAACNTGADKTKKGAEGIATDTTIKKEKTGPVVEELYACSMHPEVTGKQGDKCSKCGMNLTEPVK